MKHRLVRGLSLVRLTLAVGLAAMLSSCCASVRCSPCQPSGIYLTVLDEWTQMVLADANVSIDGKPCQAASLKGSTAFRCNVPAGSYLVDVEAVGYAPTQAMVALAPEGDGCCLCGAIAYGTASVVPIEAM